VLFSSDKSELVVFPFGRSGEYQIPTSVTYIGEDAFYDCSNLTSVTIPNSVRSIGKNAFYGCNSLTSIQVKSGNPQYCSIEGILFNSDKSELVVFPGGRMGDYQIPGYVTSIGSSAFSGCTKLSSVSIPNSVTSIGECAFSDCTGLTSVTIPSSVTSTGESIFSGCTGLQEVYLYGKYIYNDFPYKTKVYTYRECYSGSNAEYLDFLQPQHITPLMAGVAIDYSERLSSFGVDGYEIKSLKVDGTDVSLRNDGKYLVKVRPGSYYVSMVYFDPRAGRDITTTFGPYETRQDEFITFRNLTTTESTVSFEFNINNGDASADLSGAEYEFYTSGVDGEVSKTVNSEGKVTLTSLKVGSDNSLKSIVRFKDGREFRIDGPSLRTKDIELAADYQNISPTAVDLQWSYDAGDAANQVTEVRYEAPTEQGMMAGNMFYYGGTSLPLGSEVTVTYFVNTAGKEYQKTETFTLPELVLTTVNAKATSNDCAIICAETNISEIETNCGFEWRRYDAPDLVPSTFVNCPVNNGMMAGKLKGLSSNTYYKYRPFYEDMNGKRTYGEWTAFGTADAYVYFEPTVYTYEPKMVAKTSAVMTGYVLGGSDDVEEQGFEYVTVSESRAAGEAVRVPATGTRMSATLTDLLPGTTYSVRAYAATAKETTYGEEQRFTTEADEEQDAIEVVEVEAATDGAVEVFNLAGVKVADSLEGLPAGIYIVRKGSTVRKVAVK